MNYSWYADLNKPFFAPPQYVFGPVWSVLYLIIAISFGYVFYNFAKKEINFKVALPFILNLVFNFLFTPLQFGLKSNLLALVDIVLVLITIIWAMYSIYPKYRWVALAQVPYLVWVSFATVLQVFITYLNF